MRLSLTLLVASLGVAQAADISDLTSFLYQTAKTILPPLKDIAQQIYVNPELGLEEQAAHDEIVKHFSGVDGWQVTPGAYGLPTAFIAVFEHRPTSFKDSLPAIGFLAEYDALNEVGHACGHHLIAYNGISAASLAAKALVHFNVPGKIILVGTPDEENAAGKFKLNNAGAFDGSDVWLMAHPTSANAIQPMNARLNYFATFKGSTHSEAVAKAYDALVVVRNLSGKLPGTSSSATGIENVGRFATNVVQSFISLGVAGLDPEVSYTIFDDKDGVALNLTGPGGHASETTKGPLILSIETYKALKSTAGVSFYLPGNTSTAELDITVDMRTRYTADVPAVANAVSAALGSLPDRVSHDIKYPALEVTPYVPNLFVSLISSPAYGLGSFPFSTFAPASSDAAWAQDAVLDPTNHTLLSASKVVLHANYGVCDPAPGALCAFNHEPKFRIVSGTPYAFAQTEIVARAQADVAVQLINDPAKLQQATAIIKK
ncbi:hypothetical protein V8C42DRAFT_338829 [Trichoderma barbatum]